MTRYLYIVILLLTTFPTLRATAQESVDEPLMKIGWTQSQNGSIDLIIQLNPTVPTDMIRSLQVGPPSELVIADIPEFIKHDFNNIILTIGTGDVTRNPSAEVLRDRYAVRQRNALANTGGVVTGDLSSQNRIQLIDQPRGRERDTKGTPIVGSDIRPSTNNLNDTSPLGSTATGNGLANLNLGQPTPNRNLERQPGIEVPSLSIPTNGSNLGIGSQFSDLDKEQRWQNTNPQNRGMNDRPNSAVQPPFPNIATNSQSQFNNNQTQFNNNQNQPGNLDFGDRDLPQQRPRNPIDNRNPYDNRNTNLVSTNTPSTSPPYRGGGTQQPQTPPNGYPVGSQSGQYVPEYNAGVQGGSPNFRQQPNALLASNNANIYSPNNGFPANSGVRASNTFAESSNADVIATLVNKLTDETSELKEKNIELQKQLDQSRSFAETSNRRSAPSGSPSDTNANQGNSKSNSETSQSNSLIIPFLLILSVVLNGYAIIVISNLLKRYRALLSNVRTSALA